MITNKDLYKEEKEREKLLTNANADTLAVLKGILKANDILIKLVHNLRSNTVKIMEKMGIESTKKEIEDKVE